MDTNDDEAIQNAVREMLDSSPFNVRGFFRANELAKDTTLKVSITGYRGWLIRLRMAMLFIRLGCRISGMNVEFVDDKPILKDRA